MAVSINGVSKKASSGVTFSENEVSSSMLTDIKTLSEKILKDIKDPIETLIELEIELKKENKELSKEQKKELDKLQKVYKAREKNLEELVALQKTEKNIKKKAKNLPPDIQKALLEDFNRSVAGQVNAFNKEKDDLVLLSSDPNLKKYFTNHLKEIQAYTSSLEKIVKYNRSVDDARKKLSKDFFGDEDFSKGLRGVLAKGGTSILGSASAMLGPLSPLMKPLVKLGKEIPTVFTALRHKKDIKSPTEAALRKDGSPASMGAIYVADTIKKTKSLESLKDTSTSNPLGDVLDDLKDGLIIKSLPSITLGHIATGLATSAVLGVSILGIGDTIESLITKDYEELEKNAYDAGYKDASNTIDLWNNSYVQYFGDFPEVLAGSIADALTEDTFWSGLGTFVKSLGIRSFERNEAYDRGVTVAGLESYSEESGIPYDSLRFQYNQDLMFAQLSGNWNAFWEKWKDQTGVLEGVVGTPQQIWTEAEIDIMKKQAESSNAADAIGLNTPIIINQDGIPVPNPDYTPMATGSFLFPPVSLDDAIIYKDNSVYVPHPEDNIVLTKDDVGTSVLSENFEDTLLGLLREMVGRSTGNNVVIQESAMNFDFSSFRM